MKCKYCLQTNVVRNGEYYRCRDCKRNFSYSPIEDIDPEEIQRLLDRGIHRYAIAREYRCTNVAINKYIKNHNLIEPVIEKITFKK
ncbi:MAG: hypothetical protein H6911_06160 [Rickettsiaceae bacterium]|jgi:tRNA(Ile2) C34 agmatinyltransferase TiaS|nr:hypothetical protein [Rickettsiales bacterium]MCP5363518.1 hypothetical protein [Rickettsiaceae bacterium]